MILVDVKTNQLKRMQIKQIRGKIGSQLLAVLLGAVVIFGLGCWVGVGFHEELSLHPANGEEKDGLLTAVSRLEHEMPQFAVHTQAFAKRLHQEVLLVDNNSKRLPSIWQKQDSVCVSKTFFSADPREQEKTLLQFLLTQRRKQGPPILAVESPH